MSAESNQSSGESSSLQPSTTSQQSTQTLSSEEGDTEGEEESSKEESPFYEEEEYLEENEYMEEQKCLIGESYLYEQEYLEEKKCLQQEKSLEEKNYLYEEEYLERGEYIEEVTTFFTISPPIFEPASKSPYYVTKPSTSFMKDDGESLSWQDQGTQTEYIYETKGPSKLKLKTEQEGSTILSTLKSGSEAMKFVSQRNFWDDTLNEPIDTLEVEDFNDNLFKSSYDSVFRTMIKEMAAHNELEEDIYIPLTGHLESETRRKLAILMKTNFEEYKEKIQWIMKKRENLLNPKITETYTYSLCLWNQSSQIKESEIEEAKKPHHIVHNKKKLEVDTEWTKSNVKVPQGDVKVILYPNERIFQILFPDGSGQIHYPSGNLAMLILSTKESEFTYIILEDSEEMCVQALINNSGHATFYDENREIWLNLSQNLGYYFAKGKPQKAWNWWNLNLHVHAPPLQSISLNINQYIKVQIRSQDKIIFHFIHQTKHIRLNLGTKYKFILPEMLSEMKTKAILEVEFSSTARKIQILLGKMSRILNFLTICDLENFLEGTKILPIDEVPTFLPALDLLDNMGLRGTSSLPD
ncbi:glutamate-rich protein 6B [Phyllostomus hastatus]|uniref:glutamate-rich protein 6B n=1 Tax=Phyllostomus hastatus TaxID=9423 RepID=UPI001E6810B8|nr:glutamate-rich protein 6B [Phyllostomus hastatus]